MSMPDLIEALIDRGERLGNPAFFSLQFPLCHQETLQFRGGLRFRLAQVRKLSGNFRLQTGGFTLRAPCGRLPSASAFVRSSRARSSVVVASCHRKCSCIASWQQCDRPTGDILRPVEPGVSIPGTDPQGRDYVVETLQVRFRGPQAEFGLVAS